MLSTTFLSAFLVAFVLPVALATDVTLYQFTEETPSTTETIIRAGYSVTIKPIAVETSGQTVYVAEEAQSQVVYRGPHLTTTLLATPTTNTFTFRADASRYHLSLQTQANGETGTRDDDCITRADGKIVCQMQIVAGNSQTTLTVKVEQTGVPTPWYTITGVENLSLPRPTATVASAASGLISSTVSFALVVCAFSAFGAAAGVLL